MKSSNFFFCSSILSRFSTISFLILYMSLLELNARFYPIFLNSCTYYLKLVSTSLNLLPNSSIFPIRSVSILLLNSPSDLIYLVCLEIFSTSFLSIDKFSSNSLNFSVNYPFIFSIFSIETFGADFNTYIVALKSDIKVLSS